MPAVQKIIEVFAGRRSLDGKACNYVGEREAGAGVEGLELLLGLNLKGGTH